MGKSCIKTFKFNLDRQKEEKNIDGNTLGKKMFTLEIETGNGSNKHFNFISKPKVC